MQQKYLSIFLSLAIICLLFTACEKETIQSTPETAIVLDETEQALRYLNTTTTVLPFAVLEMDHSTHRVTGFFIDNTANLRKIEIEDAPYLNMDDITLDEYFMEKLQSKSSFVAEIAPTEVVEQLKIARNLKVHSNFTVRENTTTSKFFLLFTENLTGNNHNRDCIGGNRHSVAGTFNKVLLAGSGQISYEAKTEQEKLVVTWLQSMEELAGI